VSAEPTAPWTTLYDLPGRRVLFLAGRPPGAHHWGEVERDDDVSTEDVSVYRLGEGRGAPGPVVFIEARLDDRGVPVALPAGFEVGLMGSQTIWPGGVAQYIWWFDEISALSGEGGPPELRGL
jgi:hypothetical protein